MLHFVLIDIIILGEEEGFKLKKGGPSTEGRAEHRRCEINALGYQKAKPRDERTD